MEKFCLDCQSTKKCERFQTRIKTSWRECGRRRPDAGVVARALKFGVFVKKHPSHAAPVVARVQTLSHGRTRCRPRACGRCRPDVDVVARALKFGVFVKNHPSYAALVVARAQTLSPARMRSRPGTGVTARAWTLCLGADGFGRPTTPMRDRRCCRPRLPRVRLNFRGYKRPSLPFSLHFPSIRSFLAWTCHLAAPCENLTDRTLAFFSYYVICLCEPLSQPCRCPLAWTL